MSPDTPPAEVPVRYWQRPAQRAFLAALGGVLLGALVSLGLYAVLAGFTPLKREFVSGMGLFGLPFFMGAATVSLSPPARQARWGYRILAPWVSVLIVFLGLVIVAVETLICLVMLAPVLFPAASLGGVLAGWLLTRWRQRAAQRATLASVLVLPILLGPLEPMVVPTQVEHITVSDRIVIAAAPGAVWATLVQVPDIRDSELQPSFSHAIGLPRPRAALMTGQGVGAVRDLYWEDNVRFREHVTAWEPGRLLAYDVDVSPARDTLKKLDPHVVIGDRYFDVLRGRYDLRALPDGSTELSLSTTYRISTRVNGYGKFWADRTLHDFHGVVLDLLRDRVQAGPVTAARG
ncbi:hypothetical protein BER2_3984 [plant metagenome]|uniref:Uncharacterized protein n=1 Tax=plant metagenome TaxID=1297885 RepID=A0A484QGB9_9ZZZZ